MAGFGSPFYCAAGEELGGHAVYRGVFPNVVSTSPQCGSEAKRCFASTSPLRGAGGRFYASSRARAVLKTSGTGAILRVWR